MRQRKIKNLEEKLKNLEHLTVKNPEENKGNWAKVFGNNKPIYLEIGCGKGRFVTELAKANPESNYLAIEGQRSVMYKALQKAEALELTNLKFIDTFVLDVRDWFFQNEIAGVYLNFSDPWPKAKHSKRRLTAREKLFQYEKIIKPGGFIQFKTDNNPLFDFSLEEAKELGFTLNKVSRDLHNSEFNEGNVMTEYEEKFSIRGLKINYMKLDITKEIHKVKEKNSRYIQK